MVSASFVADCKSFEFVIANIWEHIDKVMEEEEEPTLPKPADLETWQLRVKKGFANLFEPATGVPAASRHVFCIDIDPAAKPPHRQP
jgi:hypothetical protein